jgi:hypothetical protein
MSEGPLTLSLHGLTLGGIVMILGMLLKQHKVWVRLKDRVNTLWRKHCKETGDDFVPLENGHL